MARDAAGHGSSRAVIHAGGTTLDVLSASFAAAVGAAILAGAVRGFSGFGSALILSPSLAALYGPAVAVPVALLLEFALAGPFVPPALKLVDRRRTATLCLAAAVMVPVGAYVLSVIDATTLRWIICALVFAAVAILGFGWRYHRAPAPRLGGAPPPPARHGRDGRDRRAQRPARRLDRPHRPARHLLRARRVVADRADARELHRLLLVGRSDRAGLVRRHGHARRPGTAAHRGAPRPVPRRGRRRGEALRAGERDVLPAPGRRDPRRGRGRQPAAVS